MQFTLSTLLVLATSLSLTTAAPSALRARSCAYPTTTITFIGADAASTFYFPVCPDGTPQYPGSDLSISHIQYDAQDYVCTFTGLHEGEGAASPAFVCEDAPGCDSLTVGPPQPIVEVICTY
jgi:hypothetical protein